MYQLSSTSRKFGDFIGEADLVDILLVGRKFTWPRLDG